MTAATIPFILCDDCGAAGSVPTHRATCPRCTLCGVRITPLMRAVPSPDGGRECFYEQACTERRMAGAA
jgi:hypothetical protein